MFCMNQVCLLVQIVNTVRYFSAHSHKFRPSDRFLGTLFHVLPEWTEDDEFFIEFPYEIY